MRFDDKLPSRLRLVNRHLIHELNLPRIGYPQPQVVILSDCERLVEVADIVQALPPDYHPGCQDESRLDELIEYITTTGRKVFEVRGWTTAWPAITAQSQ